MAAIVIKHKIGGTRLRTYESDVVPRIDEHVQADSKVYKVCDIVYSGNTVFVVVER